MDVEAAARAWVDAWDRAWRTKDVAPLAAVYAENVVFRSHPFREPQSPLEYARGAFDEESEQLELWWRFRVANTNAHHHPPKPEAKAREAALAAGELTRAETLQRRRPRRS
jgi:ketosteroid isomerase-like protein